MKSSIEKQIITINNIRDCKTVAGNPGKAYSDGKVGNPGAAGRAGSLGTAGAAGRTGEIKVITVKK